MKVLVWGSGAIGGTIGGHFTRAGHDVTFVDRALDHVSAINTKGLKITGPLAQFSVSARAFTPQTLAGRFETVLLCTKAQDTREACQALLPHVSPDGYVVSLQNGLNELIIAEIVGEDRTVGAFVNFGADYLEPGIIHYGGRGAVVLGELDGRVRERIKALQGVFLDFDEQAAITANIWGFLWGKLAYGALLFATALTNASIAESLGSPKYRQLYLGLAREVLGVAAARGIRPEGFDGFDPLAFMPGADSASLDDLVAFNRRSAKTHSGIWRDLAVRRRKTEADAQLGPSIALGAEVGIQTPLLARLVELIHELENGVREQGWQVLDELAKAL